MHGQVQLGDLSGIRDLEETESGVSFLYSGDISRLLQTLSEGNIKDLSVSEPDLEEIFLHYYEKDGDQA